MKSPIPGLNPIHYDARSAAKVQIVVQPGDTLFVSDDVAAQLQASSAQFKPSPEANPAPKTPAKKTAAKKG